MENGLESCKLGYGETKKKWLLRFPAGEFDHDRDDVGQQVDLTCAEEW
jgi:hypothetical protein